MPGEGWGRGGGRSRMLAGGRRRRFAGPWMAPCRVTLLESLETTSFLLVSAMVLLFRSAAFADQFTA